MGCDIHIFLEVKLNDKWEMWDTLEQSRDYDLFAAISNNLRFDELKIKKLKFTEGLPKDCSNIVKFRLATEDYHSHAFMTSKESRKLLTKDFYIVGDLKWTILEFSDKNFYYRKRGVKDFRLVYAFDS